MLSYQSATPVGRYTIFDNASPGVAGVVLDEQTGHKTTAVLPADCPTPAEDSTAGGPWLLAYCTTSIVDLYSLPGNYWRTVRIAAACRNFHGTDCEPYAVGRYWIEYDEESERDGDVFVFQNIATGIVRPDPTNATAVADLNSPRLSEHLCRPLGGTADVTVTPDGQFAIASGPAGTFLERCGSRLHLALQGAMTVAMSPHVLLWLNLASGSLEGISLPSLRRFRIATPHADLVDVELSERHVYLEAQLGRPPFSRLWSAPLSNRALSSVRSAVAARQVSAPDANLVLARSDAARILGSVPLERGSTVMTIDPFTGKPFGPSGDLGNWQVVRSGHWLVPVQFYAVERYLKAHRPAGAQEVGYGLGGSPPEWNETLSFPTTRGAISSAALELDISPYGSSKTELDAAVTVLWRPTWEEIPTTTRALAISVDHGPTLTITSRRAITAVARVFSGLSVVGPGTVSCGLGIDQFATVTMLGTARRKLGSLFVDDRSCTWVNFRLGAMRGAQLWDAGVLDLLWREHGVSTCGAAQLAAKAVRSQGSGAAFASIDIKNTSSTECSLDGYPKLELRNVNAQRLGVRVLQQPRTPAGLATEAPGDTLQITADWPRGRSRCPTRAVASIVLTFPRMPDRVVAQAQRPLSVCRGPVTISPLGPPI